MQRRIVSANTSKIPYRPWVLGSASTATEWAIAEVPSPASLEKMPRDAPINMVENTLPTAPPVTALGLKAPAKIILKHLGSVSIFLQITKREIMMYTTDIKGTIFSVMFAILFRLPDAERKTETANTIPKIRRFTGVSQNETRAEFVWVIFPLKITEGIAAKQNIMLKGLKAFPKPFLI